MNTPPRGAQRLLQVAEELGDALRGEDARLCDCGFLLLLVVLIHAQRVVRVVHLVHHVLDGQQHLVDAGAANRVGGDEAGALATQGVPIMTRALPLKAVKKWPKTRRCARWPC